MDVLVSFCVSYMKNSKHSLTCIEYRTENFSKKNNFILIEHRREPFDFKFIRNFIISICKAWIHMASRFPYTFYYVAVKIY